MSSLNPRVPPAAGAPQRPPTGPCQTTFRSAMKERRSKHPFDRISAYKVRESRDNMHDECRVVASIAEYLRAHPYDRHSSMLRGCTEEDKAHRLKRTPHIIAHELGYNLIPAIEALTLEGVPAADINAFIRSIKPQVDQLLADCDAVQKATARSIKPAYDAMKTGSSSMERICAEALGIAEQAVTFCEGYGVL